jgi:8-oxo-dGTP pyrophosphatase MutT (NUDIX family)
LTTGVSIKYDLPKGTLHIHETLEQCALREVIEESGQKGKVVGYLGGRLDDSVDARTDMRISKITHYFAIKWLADTGAHDDEYLRSEWLPVKRAQELLKPSSADIVARFKEFVSTFPNNI